MLLFSLLSVVFVTACCFMLLVFGADTEIVFVIIILLFCFTLFSHFSVSSDVSRQVVYFQVGMSFGKMVVR